MAEIMLTTEDNPYNPFTHFDDWYAFDTQKGYHTCEYIARIAMTSDECTDAENDYEIERAIQEILSYNLTGNYKTVSA